MMPWAPGTLLGLQNTTRPFGRFPGDSVFIMLGMDPITTSPILLSGDGRKTIIPAVYLVPVACNPPSAVV